MPSLGSGLSLGTLNSLPGYDFDVSAFIQQTGVANSITVPQYGNNYLPSSNNFSDTALIWSHGLCSVTPNALSNPFGTATDASLLSNINASFGNILRMQNFQVSQYLLTNTRYLWSTYAKANASNFIGFRLGDIASNAGNNYSNVNLSNGTTNLLTPANGTNHSLTATAVGNGWYRIAYSFTNASSTTNVLDIAVCQSDGQVGTISPAGTRSVYIWGTQLEFTSSTSASPYAETGSNTAIGAQLRTSGTLLTETINPRKQLNDFVVGVKGLGLWNNMVCWPLRSPHNTGTGLTAYSLGGLGAYNATITNGPVWNTKGVTTNGSSQHAESNIPTSSTWSVLVNSQRSSLNDSPAYYWGLHFSAKTGSLSGVTYFLNDGGNGLFQSENGTNNWSPSRPGFQFTRNSGFHSVAYSETGPSASVSLDGAFSAQTAVRNLSSTRLNRMIFGARKTTTSVDLWGACSTSFIAYFNTQLSNSEVESIRSLYKTTLGTGLGLP